MTSDYSAVLSASGMPSRRCRSISQSSTARLLFCATSNRLLRQVDGSNNRDFGSQVMGLKIRAQMQPLMEWVIAKTVSLRPQAGTYFVRSQMNQRACAAA